MIEQPPDDVTGEKIPRVFLNSDGGYSALSWNGFNLLGNSASIAEAKKAQYAQQYLDGLRTEIAILRAEAQQNADLANSLSALVNAIDFEGEDGAVRFAPGSPWEDRRLAQARGALAKAAVGR